MEQHDDQIATSWSFLVETEENSFRSLKEENQALREQVSQLQQSESQLQKDLKREVKKRRARSKAYLDCMNLLTVEGSRLQSCEARWAAKLKELDVSVDKEMAVRENVWRRRVKELERERQLDKERLQQLQQEWRRAETRANELICKLQSQIQALKTEEEEEEEKEGACHRCQTVLDQKNDELQRAEVKWKVTLSKLNASAERELAFRDNVWRKRVKELEQEKRRDTEECQRTEDKWKTAERWENNLICELQQQLQLLKEEEEEEGGRQREGERQEKKKKREWWMNENQLTEQIWA